MDAVGGQGIAEEEVMSNYERETFGDGEEAETMNHNVDEFEEAIIGHRIVMTAQQGKRLRITLDNGRTVTLRDSDDCCAYTEVSEFLARSAMTEHVITGVKTSDEFNTWHIMAKDEKLVDISVDWSSGNTGYYMYGFYIDVEG